MKISKTGIYRLLKVLIVITTVLVFCGCASKSKDRDGSIRSNIKEDGKVLEKGDVKDKGRQSIKKKAAKKAVKTITAGAAVKKVKDGVKDRVGGDDESEEEVSETGEEENSE